MPGPYPRWQDRELITAARLNAQLDAMEAVEDGVAAKADASAVAALTPAVGMAIVGGASGPEQVAITALGGGASPPTLPAIPGLFFRLDATDLALADGDRVAAWTDKVTGTKQAVQATAANQPRFDIAGLNLKPAVYFDSTRNDNLVATSLAPGVHQATVFVVCRRFRPASGNRYVFGTSGSAKALYTAAAGTVGLQQVSTFSAPAVDDMPQLVAGVYNDASSAVRVDGVETTGDAGVAVTLPTNFYIGHRSALTAGQGLTGWISEVLYYNRALAPGERAAVEAYLAAKWGLDILPTNTFYVDSVLGATSNSARSAAKPGATLQGVLDRIAARKLTDATIRVTAPEGSPLRITAFVGPTGERRITFRSAVDGVPWYVYGSQQFTSGWTSVGGGIYSRPLTLAAGTGAVAWSPILRDSDGQPLRCLTQNTATPTTPAAGEFGYSGGTYYLHLPGDIDPNTTTIEVASLDTGLATGSGADQVTVFDCWGYGFRARAFSNGNSADGTTGNGYLAAYRCHARFCGDSGFANTGYGRGVYAEDCTARYCTNDGFNHHGNAGNTATMELVRCDGSWNNDEGVSPHEDTYLVLRDFTGNHNGSSGLCAVNNARVWLYGANEFDHNGRLTPATAGSNNGISALETAQIVVESAYAHHNPGPGIYEDATATVTVKPGVRSGLAEGNGAADVI